jgi:hypothetical protein
MGGGQLRITVPESVELEEWLPVLRAELEKLGYREGG